MMKRLLLSALVALAPAWAAAAQVRMAPSGAPTLVPSLAAVGALAPALSAGAAAALSAGGLSVPAPFAPAAAMSAAPVAAIPPLPAAAITVAAAPGSAAALPVPGGKRPLLRSLKELSHYFQTGSGAQAAQVYDGARTDAGQPVVDPAGIAPSIPAGVREVLVVPLRADADVDRVVPGLGNSRALRAALKSALPGLQPLDAFVYRDGHGGSFVGLDLSRHPENADRMPEIQPHELDTIKKLQAFTRDLQVLVREEGQTPDLVVGGVVTELKSVHRHDRVSVQLAHANAQLLAHSRRHGLGRGAVVLDVLDAPKAVPERVEAEIETVLKSAPAVGFARVHVFAGGELQTYSPGADGAFRLDPVARPFAPGRPVPAGPSFVPAALERAVLPEMATVVREIQEPSRLLRAHGIRATVTVYGSARILSPEAARAALDAVAAETGKSPRDAEGKRRLLEARNNLAASKYYAIARELGAQVAKEGRGQVAVVSGGGPGIMEAANRGAFEAGGPSVGYNIRLPHEQSANPYATRELEFTFENFSTRKMSLRHGAMGLAYFPGGFGTMDELFEVLTLIQTGKMARVPIVLVGEKSYWAKVLDFDEFARMGLIAKDDLSLFTFAETAEQAWKAIVLGQTPAARP